MYIGGLVEEWLFIVYAVVGLIALALKIIAKARANL